MAKCVKCGKKGLFLRTDQFGLCPTCSAERMGALFNLCNHKYGEDRVDCPPNLTWPALGHMIETAVNNSLRILADSSQLIEKTANADTFYSRRELLINQLNYLIDFERIDPSLFKNEAPSSLAPQMIQAAKEAEINMWKRRFDALMDKVVNYKTDKGKSNAVNIFFSEAESYTNQMSADAKNQIEKLRKRFEITL